MCAAVRRLLVFNWQCTRFVICLGEGGGGLHRPPTQPEANFVLNTMGGEGDGQSRSAPRPPICSFLSFHFNACDGLPAGLTPSQAACFPVCSADIDPIDPWWHFYHI